MRVTPELVNVETGYRLWSDSYDRPLKDIFDIQKEIAGKVAEALQVTLGVGSAAAPGMTRNVAAYEEWLRALSFLNAYRPDSFQPAVDHAQRAISLDPSFANAWLAVSFIYANGSGMVPEGLLSGVAVHLKRSSALVRSHRTQSGRNGSRRSSLWAMADGSRPVRSWTSFARRARPQERPGSIRRWPRAGSCSRPAGRRTPSRCTNAPGPRNRFRLAWPCILANPTPSLDESRTRRPSSIAD